MGITQRGTITHYLKYPYSNNKIIAQAKKQENKTQKGDRNYLRDKTSDLTKQDFKVTIINKFVEQRKSMIKK